MGAFEYTAVDSSGKERRGVLEGDTPRQVRQLLRERALLPLQVTEVAQKEARRVKQGAGAFQFGLRRPSLSALEDSRSVGSRGSWRPLDAHVR